MHVVIVLQHYHTPDCPTAGRPHALVTRLARDHEVSLVTTSAWTDRRVAHRFDWVPAGVRYRAFDIPYRNAMSAPERFWSFLRFAARALSSGLRLPRPDLIIGSSTPLSAAAAAALVARFRGVPWLFEVRDLWPEFPVQMGAIPSVLQPPLYALEAALYRSAAHVVTASPDMEWHVSATAPATPVTTIEYGTDRSLLPAPHDDSIRAELGLDARPLVLYAGALGRANAIPTLLSATQRLRTQPNPVQVAIAGHGVHAPHVRAAARTWDHLTYLADRSYPTTLRLFETAALSIVSFADRPVLSTNAPSKFFDSLSAGTPVLVTQDGWTRRFVERHNCGWPVPPESPGALATRIRHLLGAPDRLREAGHHARRAAAAHFDRATHMDRYARLVDHIGHHSQT